MSFEDGLIIVIHKWVLEFQAKTNWLPKLLVSVGFHKKSLSGYEANGFYIKKKFRIHFCYKRKKKKIILKNNQLKCNSNISMKRMAKIISLFFLSHCGKKFPLICLFNYFILQTST